MPDRLTKAEREEARKTCAKLLDSRRRYVMPSTATDVAQNYLPRLLDDLDRVEGEVGRLEKRDAIASKAMQAVAGLQVCADIGALAETARWRKTARRMAGEARRWRRAETVTADAREALVGHLREELAKKGIQDQAAYKAIRKQRDTARAALAQRDGWIRMLVDGVCPKCGQPIAAIRAPGVPGVYGHRAPDSCGYSITAAEIRAGLGGS